jgi:epoxyqueuosine reductase
LTLAEAYLFSHFSAHHFHAVSSFNLHDSISDVKIQISRISLPLSKHQKSSPNGTLFNYQKGPLVHVLLHCCCAPCSCAIIERLSSEGVSFSLFFYNPNIHPQDEYERRKAELIRYARVPFIDTPYDPKAWFLSTKGHELDQERKERCALCFRLRLCATARYAAAHGFSHIATTLGMSRRKDFAQVTEAGFYAASTQPGLTFLNINWKKGGGSARAEQISKEESFYRQRYCGCLYTART